jgi:hypothetical protein
MDLALQALGVLAAFAAVHERVIEIIRGFRDQWGPKWAAFIDAITKGRWSWLSGVGLALVTNANLLFLFQKSVRHPEASRFMEEYLQRLPERDLPSLMGCLFMGVAATMGSQVWHDLSKGLVDARNVVKSLPATAAPAPPPGEPPKEGISAALPPVLARVP